LHISGATCSGSGPVRAKGRHHDELRVETRPETGAQLPDVRSVALDKVVSDPRIHLLLDTTCVGCETNDGFIRRVRATRSSTEEEFEIEAQFFADCSGDGRLGKEAGADSA
jgi:hypothetical protein